MRCKEIAGILDERSRLNLAAADRAAVDAHLVCCGDCAAAWGADEALAALPIPQPPPGLLPRALEVSRVGSRTPPRRGGTRRALGAALLVAGAALAAAAAVKWAQESRAPAAQSAPAPLRDAPTSGVTPGTAAQQLAPASTSEDDANDRIALPDSDFFMLVQVPPRYPPAALAKHLEGSVKLGFGITKDGSVTDVKVVESSDAQFEPFAALAVSRWKYMPRIAGGKRVSVPHSEAILRFQLVGNASETTEEPPPAPEHGLNWQEFDERMAPAWDCAGDQHLRCAELALDELTATYSLDDMQVASVANFYGYIYTQYEDYGRAIGAYQTAIRHAGPIDHASLALAHLYFTRHQYDRALATLEAYSAAYEKAVHKTPPSTVEFIAKLKLLLSVP
jgi:TonB family protein